MESSKSYDMQNKRSKCEYKYKYWNEYFETEGGNTPFTLWVPCKCTIYNTVFMTCHYSTKCGTVFWWKFVYLSWGFFLKNSMIFNTIVVWFW